MASFFFFFEEMASGFHGPNVGKRLRVEWNAFVRAGIATVRAGDLTHGGWVAGRPAGGHSPSQPEAGASCSCNIKLARRPRD